MINEYYISYINVGYGEDPKNIFDKIYPFCEQHGFILLTPFGGTIDDDKLSWNGNQCCGESLEHGYEHIGFMQLLITKIVNTFNQYSDRINNIKLNHETVFILGYDNGAFLADKIAWNIAVKKFQYITGLSIVSGYIYEHNSIIKYQKDKIPLNIMFNYFKNDNIININGCCSKYPCSYNIRYDTCHSIFDEYNEWIKWNKCAPLSIDINATINSGSKYDHISGKNCNMATELGLYYDSKNRHIISKDIINNSVSFFLKTLCTQQNGKFYDYNLLCECDKNLDFYGPYCASFDSSNDDTKELIETKEHEIKVKNGEYTETSHNDNDLIMDNSNNDDQLSGNQYREWLRFKPETTKEPNNDRNIFFGSEFRLIIITIIAAIIGICIICNSTTKMIVKEFVDTKLTFRRKYERLSAIDDGIDDDIEDGI